MSNSQSHFVVIASEAKRSRPIRISDSHFAVVARSAGDEAIQTVSLACNPDCFRFARNDA
jgi:hypothetical protein